MEECLERELPVSGLHSVVRSLPTRGVAGIVDLPFLFSDSGSGEVTLNLEALEYARASLAGYDVSTIELDIRAVGRLYDFCHAFWGSKPLPDGGLEYLIYAYLIWRHHGTIRSGASCLGGLRWKPLAPEGLRAEFKSVMRYIHFSERRWGHVSLGLFRARPDQTRPLAARFASLAEQKERDFLVHLNASREYWARQHGHEFEMPRVAAAARRGPGVRTVITAEEIWAIIGEERNPAFRALWLTGAFGGIRISEQLNMWQVDVLPSTHRKLIFNYEGGDDVLLLRADPVNSRYTGEIGHIGPTRREVLRDRYGMRPRKGLGKADPLNAGWKGTLWLDSQRLLSEVFWLDARAAELYAECAAEIRDFHHHHRTSERHPFLYVNMADPTGKFRGDILKISNVEAAWERACRRCDLQPHRWGRNIHGMRHFYKALAQSMEISAEHLQIMMGHRSMESQKDYGRAARQVSQELTMVRTRRNGGGTVA